MSFRVNNIDTKTYDTSTKDISCNTLIVNGVISNNTSTTPIQFLKGLNQKGGLYFGQTTKSGAATTNNINLFTLDSANNYGAFFIEVTLCGYRVTSNSTSGLTLVVYITESATTVGYNNSITPVVAKTAITTPPLLMYNMGSTADIGTFYVKFLSSSSYNFTCFTRMMSGGDTTYNVTML